MVTEREAMEHALELALVGWGRVAPNPMVGAVLMRDGEIVGEGYHAEFGGPHAEIVALRSCDDPRGATCVVNLEPCAHTGKTPPCADALIEAGIARVVYAVNDPDGSAAGGAASLRAAGVAVESGVCAEDAAALNAPFLYSHLRPERPFVAVKVATSLDGFLADSCGRSQWISEPDSRAFVQWLRAGFAAIGVGRRTAATDDPQLTAREVIPRVPPIRVVFSKSGDLSPELQLVRTAAAIPTVLVTSLSGRERAMARLTESQVRYVVAGDLESAMQGLRAAGVRSILIEGGGALVGALLEADLVDRVYWIIAPLWLGDGVSAFGRRTAAALEDAERWAVTERRALGQDTLLVVDRAPCLRE